MKIIPNSLFNASGTYAYIVFVSLVMSNGEKFFGRMIGAIGEVAVLTLFVLSVAIVGGFILGKPILLYMDGKKKEAVKLFHETIAWLAILVVITFIYLATKQ